MSRRRSRSSVLRVRFENSGPSGVTVESLISLEYPNGRTHDATLLGEALLEPGQEFDLHGRRWRAVEPRRRRRPPVEPVRILCRAVDPT